MDVCIYLMSAIGIKMEVEEGASATVNELILALVDEEELNLPRQTTTTSNAVSNTTTNSGSGSGVGGSIIPLGEIFTLWMTSPLLDVQLKPHHKVKSHNFICKLSMSLSFTLSYVRSSSIPLNFFISFSLSTSAENGTTFYRDSLQLPLNANHWMNQYYPCKGMSSFTNETRLNFGMFN